MLRKVHSGGMPFRDETPLKTRLLGGDQCLLDEDQTTLKNSVATENTRKLPNQVEGDRELVY